MRSPFWGLRPAGEAHLADDRVDVGDDVLDDDRDVRRGVLAEDLRQRPHIRIRQHAHRVEITVVVGALDGRHLLRQLEDLAVAAVPEQVKAARAFVAGVLGGSCPLAEVAVLLTSEVVANSVRHSGSAAGGGLVTETAGGGVRVEVTHRSGDGSPVLLPVARADCGAEGGRGMRLVDALAARWGYQRAGGHATTWFELTPD